MKLLIQLVTVSACTVSNLIYADIVILCEVKGKETIKKLEK